MKEIIIDEKIILKYGIVLTVLQIIIFIIPFMLIWGWGYTVSGFNKFALHFFYWLIPIIILHEGLHGLVWALGIKGGFNKIKFGFNKEMLAPYTHCKVPLKKRTYLAGGAAPLVIMGIIPAIVSFIYGNPYWYCFSQMAIWTSIGDIISCYYLLKISSEFKIQDHPEKLGFIIMQNSE